MERRGIKKGSGMILGKNRSVLAYLLGIKKRKEDFAR